MCCIEFRKPRSDLTVDPPPTSFYFLLTPTKDLRLLA